MTLLEESSDIPNFHGHPSESYWSFHSKPRLYEISWQPSYFSVDGSGGPTDRLCHPSYSSAASLLKNKSPKPQTIQMRNSNNCEKRAKSDLVCFPFCHFDSIDSTAATIRLLFIEYQCLEPPPPPTPGSPLWLQGQLNESTMPAWNHIRESEVSP